MADRRPRLLTLTTPLSLAGIVGLGVAIYLSGQILRDPTSAPMRHEVAPAAPWSHDFQGRISQMTQLIEGLKLPVRLPTPAADSQGAGNLRWIHRRYDIELAKPARSEDLDNLLAPLRSVPDDVSVHDSDDDDGKLLTVGIDGLLTHTLHFHWRQRPPRIAIIVDNLGDDLLLARDLVTLPAPLTFAVKPLQPFSAAVAERARLAGREVLLQLSIDSEPSKKQPLSKTAKPDEEKEDPLLISLDQALAALPQATGTRANLSTRFAKEPERIRAALALLKQRSVFVVDAYDVDQGTACALAQPLHEPCTVETVRLDETDDAEVLRKKIALLRAQARQRGDLVVSMRGRPAVVEALRAELADFAREQIDVVSVSETLAPAALSRR